MESNVNISDSSGRKPLIGLTLQGLREVAARYGMPAFAAKQMARRLYVNRTDSIAGMTELSKAAREKLEAHYCVGLHAPLASSESADGTVKYLFPGVGGRNVEAVYIPDGDRATLCVSSQAGCKMNCSFCMTGRQGFHGNLSAADIINQVLSVPASETLTNLAPFSISGRARPAHAGGKGLPAVGRHRIAEKLRLRPPAASVV